MGRRRTDCGSAGIEYTGILLIVAAALVIGTAAAPDLRRTITDGVARAEQCAVAMLLGTTCPGGTSGDDHDGGPDDEAEQTPPPGYPTAGPTIGNGEDIDYGLPWPGEWHVGISDDGPLQGELSVTEDMGDCRLDEDGDPRVELSVTTDLRLTGELDTKNVDLSAFTGHELTYGISTDPETADEIAGAGDGGPQPVDPRSIPVGTAITLDETFYEGTGLSAAYRALQVELEYSEGHRVSSGIERIDATHVRINVGDSEVVEQTVGLGLGSEDLVAGLNGMTSDEDGKLTSVDVDISTPRGWAAYQAFLNTGYLPRAGARGVSNMTYADFSAWQSKQDLGLKYKDLGLSWNVQDLGGREVTTHNADGTESYSWVVDWGDDNDVTIVRTAETGVNGETTAKSRLFQVKDVDTLGAQYLDRLTPDEDADIGDDEDVTLRFTDAQLMAMRHAALEQLAYHVKLEGNDGGLFDGDDPAAEVAEYLEKVPDGLSWAGMSPTVLDIAQAKTPDGVFDELTDEAHSAEDLILFLDEFGNDTVEARHGVHAEPSDYPDDYGVGTITHRPTGC